MLYPELVYELVGPDVYDECDRHLARSTANSEDQKRAMEDLHTALLQSPAFTTGFKCSVSFGWEKGVPKADKLQAIYLRRADPKPSEVPAPPSEWPTHRSRMGARFTFAPETDADMMTDGPGANAVLGCSDM
jgi:hypothetical protein